MKLTKHQIKSLHKVFLEEIRGGELGAQLTSVMAKTLEKMNLVKTLQIRKGNFYFTFQIITELGMRVYLDYFIKNHKFRGI